MPSGRENHLGISACHQSGGGLAGDACHACGDTGLTQEVDQNRTGDVGECTGDSRVGHHTDDDIAEGRGDPRRGSTRERGVHIDRNLLGDNRLQRRVDCHAGDHVCDGCAQCLHQTGVGQRHIHRGGDGDTYRVLER